MKIAVILGTRPEIIKMSHIIRECEQLHLEYLIVDTGQHYSYTLDRVFYDQLELPHPAYNLDVGSGSHAEQTGNILMRLENVLQKEHPAIVLVEGDTNTVLAGALAASKLHIPGGHVEAGLRSYDRTMPEEINRVLTDHASDLLFTPTQKSRQVLLGEGIPENKIFVTSNTIVDAVMQNVEIAQKKLHKLDELHLTKQQYFLVTTHRQENVDDHIRFQGILTGLSTLHNRYHLPIIYPIHPRARKKMHEFHLSSNGVNLVDPLDFLAFLQLKQHAKVVLTDSGGVQDETCVLGIPCVTLRDNTERPETLEVGSNILAGTTPDDILKCVSLMAATTRTWKNPFGNGKAAKTIMKIIQEFIP